MMDPAWHARLCKTLIKPLNRQVPFRYEPLFPGPASFPLLDRLTPFPPPQGQRRLSLLLFLGTQVSQLPHLPLTPLLVRQRIHGAHLTVTPLLCGEGVPLRQGVLKCYVFPQMALEVLESLLAIDHTLFSRRINPLKLGPGLAVEGLGASAIRVLLGFGEAMPLRRVELAAGATGLDLRL